MSSKRPKARPRKLRADAQRNLTRILEIAKDAFTRSGANIGLDEVARRAHIGTGTLYRHFPANSVMTVETNCVFRAVLNGNSAYYSKILEAVLCLCHLS